MTTSYTTATTFTIAHARRLAARVTTDLYQSHSLYGSPSEVDVGNYQAELETLLAGKYVAKYEFGFQLGTDVRWSLRYTVGADGGLASDDRGGGVPVGVAVAGASFFNVLTPSDSWYAIGTTAQNKILSEVPIVRGIGAAPVGTNGYWTTDRHYTAGGVAIEREVFRKIA